MATPELVEQAKQGNPDAISDLINQSLQPKGITVTASINQKSLIILAESEKTPDQKLVTQAIEKGIVALKPKGIERMILKGKASHQKNPAWRQVLDLAPPLSPKQPLLAKIQHLQSNSTTSQVLTRLKGAQEMINTALLASILLTVLVGGRNFSSATGSYWEYRVEGIEDSFFELKMQELGAQGWELASARRAISGEGETSQGLYEVIFRRPVTAMRARRNLHEVKQAQAELAREITQDLAELRLNSTLRAQQTHWILNDRLAASPIELDLTAFKSDDKYAYDLTLVDANKAQVTAIAQQPGLKSYIGAVFIVGDSAETIVCGTEAASKKTPPSPTLFGSEPRCADGTQPVD